MAKKKKETIEFRFYDVPQGENVLVLMGESWNRVYGHDETGLHFQNLMEIGICRRGQGILGLNKEKMRFKTGDITIIPENYPHITVSDGENPNFWEYLFFNPKSIIEELFPGSPAFQNEVMDHISKRPLILKSEEHPTLLRMFDSILEEKKNEKKHYNLMIRFFIRAFVVEMLRQYSKEMEMTISAGGEEGITPIAPALKYINENYASQIKAGKLAEVCNISETHFRRLFEEHTNMSPMDYVNLIRIQNACELMKKTSDSMDVVATKCGFSTTSTFNRNFKKFLDTSPYQWKINPENYEGKLQNYHISALKGW